MMELTSRGKFGVEHDRDALRFIVGILSKKS